MNRVRIFALLVGLLVFSLDLLTKWWVESTHWLHYYPVVDGLFTIHYVRNEGIAFGLFHSLQSEWKVLVLLSMGVLALGVVLFYIWTTPADQGRFILTLGLLLGGILGNFVDRLANHHVTDFLELHWKAQFSWPTFNLADAAITCGVFLIFYDTFTGRHLENSEQDETLAS